MPYRYSYRGDPGIFSTLGGVFRGVGSILPGPIGGLAKGLGGIMGGSRSPRAIASSRYQIPNTLPTPGVRGALQRAMPGGATGMDVAPKGYRLNKTSYYLKDGTFVPAGSRFVRVRRRNPANVRALRRALSRVESFGGVVKRARKSTRKVKNI